jgi:AbrB family looped-hinge helix DNA binding protein
MKATGIVRRIDELGRIIIPKEIRRTCHLKEGDQMEIYLGEDGEIVLQKYDIEPEITALRTAVTLLAGTIDGERERTAFTAWTEKAIEHIVEEMRQN